MYGGTARQPVLLVGMVVCTVRFEISSVSAPYVGESLYSYLGDLEILFPDDSTCE